MSARMKGSSAKVGSRTKLTTHLLMLEKNVDDIKLNSFVANLNTSQRSLVKISSINRSAKTATYFDNQPDGRGQGGSLQGRTISKLHLSSIIVGEPFPLFTSTSS